MEFKAVILANRVWDLTGVNVFAQSRKPESCYIRAMFMSIIYHDLKMGWSAIKSLYIKNDWKTFNHATAVNAVNRYPDYKKYEPTLKKLEQVLRYGKKEVKEDLQVLELTNEISKLKAELTHIKSSDLMNLISKVPQHKISEVKNKIEMCIKSWEWKTDDKLKHYGGYESVQGTW